MGYFLFLSQDKSPQDINLDYLPKSGWKIVRNFEQFELSIREFGAPDFVYLSHNLHNEHGYFTDYRIALSSGKIDYSKYKNKTGLECVKYLINYCKDNNIKFPRYEIDQDNLVGYDNILKEINNSKQ